MTTRLAAILALLAPQLWLPALSLGRVEAECGATSCCIAVESTTCCGETVVEMQCAKSGGVCLCGLEQDRPGAPTPPPPVVEKSRTLVAVLARPLGRVAAPVRPDGPTARAFTGERCPRSHNTARALLGVWVT